MIVMGYGRPVNRRGALCHFMCHRTSHDGAVPLVADAKRVWIRASIRRSVFARYTASAASAGSHLNPGGSSGLVLPPRTPLLV
jgi:hypothetical protein